MAAPLMLAKRLDKYRDGIFTFLNYQDVPFENNHAECQIRPALVLRKNSQPNRSEKSEATQSVLMNVYTTLKLKRHDPLTVIDGTIRDYVSTGELFPLPGSARIVEGG